MKSRTVFKFLATLCGFLIVFLFIGANNVFALDASTMESMALKWKIQALVDNCSFSDESIDISSGNYAAVSSLFSKNENIPSYSFNSAESFSCKSLAGELLGDENADAETLRQLGYTADTSSNKVENPYIQISFTYRYFATVNLIYEDGGWSLEAAESLINLVNGVEIDENNNLVFRQALNTESLEKKIKDEGHFNFDFTSGYQDGHYYCASSVMDKPSDCFFQNGTTYDTISLNNYDADNLDDLATEITNLNNSTNTWWLAYPYSTVEGGGMNYFTPCENGSSDSTTCTIQVETTVYAANSPTIYSPPSDTETLKTYLLEKNNLNAASFSTDEKYELYSYYLNEFKKASQGENSDNTIYDFCPENTNGLTQIAILGNDGQWYAGWVNLQGSLFNNIDKEIKRGVDFKVYDDPTITITLGQIVDWINKNALTSMGLDTNEATVTTLSDYLTDGCSADENIDAVVGEDLDSDEVDSEYAKCKNVLGSNALAWFLCPAIELLQGAFEKAYANYVEPLLEVDVGFMDSNSGTHTAWEIFRNIANIIFVILFMIVLISQLTGVGIDNYGIKKILPRLIVVAILVNLSFVICQLAVDISNLLGNGLKNLFDGIEIENVNVTSQDDWMMSLLGIGVIGGGAFFVFFGGIGLLIGAISTIFSALVAILFMFIMLAIRQAGVLILVTVSPIAFVCYLLPGTQAVFRKWLSYFKGLLILYPTIGLVLGGSFMASKILATGGANASAIVRLVAVILMVAPYFFIPSLARGALNVTGHLGDKLSGLSARAGRHAGNVPRVAANSEMGQNLQKRVRAGKDTLVGRGLGKISGGRLGKRASARAGRAKVELASEKANINRQASADYVENRVAGIQAQEDQQKIDDVNARIDRGGIQYKEDSSGNKVFSTDAKKFEETSGETKTLSSTDNKSMGQFMESAVKNGDVYAASAAYQKLADNKNGIDELSGVYQNLSKQKDVNGNNMDQSKAFRTVSQKIAANGKIKAANRNLQQTALDFSNGIMPAADVGTAYNARRDSGYLNDKTSVNEIPDMSSGAFLEYVGAQKDKNGNLSFNVTPERKQKVIDSLQAIQKDTTLQGNLKGERLEAAKQAYRAYGLGNWDATPPPQP